MGGALVLALALRIGGADEVLPLEVGWRAPATCPTAADVHADIEMLVGFPMAGEGARVVFDARVEPAPEGLVLRVERRDPEGAAVEHSVVEASDCTTLSRAFALIVAVDAEPMRVDARQESTAAPPPVPRVPSVPPPPVVEIPPEVPARPEEVSSGLGTASVEAPPSDPTPPRWRQRWLIGAHGGIAWGTTPKATVVAGGWTGVAFGPLRLELSGEHAVASVVQAQDGVSIRAQSTGGAAMLRFTPSVRGLAVVLGAGLAAGRMRGSGTGARVIPRDARDWWLSVPVSLGLEWPEDAIVALRAQGEVGFALRRPAIEVRAPDGRQVAVVRRPPAALQFVVGPRLRLP